MRRYLEEPIRNDLAEKMVFLAGPRQVGKTTIAKAVMSSFPSGGLYLNWDNREDRARIRKALWPAGEAIVVLDEIHKWRGWKGWIKGEYDVHRDRLRFLITGSARLDVYRRGGDSLQGRYHHYRLHPLSCSELETGGNPRLPVPSEELPIPAGAPSGHLDALMEYGGFPEPLLAHSPRTLRRWQKERLDRFFREDVRDLEPIRDLGNLQLMADLLPGRVGSPFSLNALREDLAVSHRALTHWMEVLERLYHCFSVKPFTAKRVAALRRMPKVYLWDASLVPGRAARFENVVALHLLKLCHLLQDREGHDVTLHYLRDRAGHETDFLVAHRGRPWFAVEAKSGPFVAIEPSLRYFRERVRIPWVYQTHLEGDADYLKDGIRVLPARKLLAALV